MLLSYQNKYFSFYLPFKRTDIILRMNKRAGYIKDTNFL